MIKYHSVQGVPAGLVIQNAKGQQFVRLVDGNFLYRKRRQLKFYDASIRFGSLGLAQYIDTLGPFKEPE